MARLGRREREALREIQSELDFRRAGGSSRRRRDTGKSYLQVHGGSVDPTRLPKGDARRTFKGYSSIDDASMTWRPQEEAYYRKWQ